MIWSETKERNKTMTNKNFVFVALAAAFATSCSTDDLTEQEQRPTEGKTMTLTASMDENQTRVGMTKDGTTAKFYWHKDDKILVQTKKSDGTFSGTEFTTTETATGAASATFTGKVSGTVGQYAVFPYNENHKFTDDKTLTYHLPNSYTYTTVESNIFSNGSTYPTNNTNMPMLGIIANGKISFTHLAGLAVIRIDKMPAESGTFTVTADKQLSGDFTVSDISASGAQIATSTASGDNGKVTFTFSGATEGGIGVFYLPLATGEYTNVKIAITYNSTSKTASCGSLTIARKSVTAIPLSTDSSGNLRYIVKNNDGTYTINGHTFVDLGLSVLWAKTNVGASSETADGGYFAWGETTTKDSYRKVKYTFFYDEASEYTRYNETDKKTTLEAADDAATVNWGVPCRMPTQAEFKELLKSTNFEWKTIDDVNGYQVTSKKDGYTTRSIFLPASGLYNGNETLSSKGSAGYYWSCSASSDAFVWAVALEFNTGTCPYDIWDSSRFTGCSVRAVAEKP